MTTEQQINELIGDGIASLSYPTVAPGLYAPIIYTLDSGGKRLRPRLVLSSFMAFAPEKNPAEALPQALGLEIFHNFTLLHDDVMDSADLRRGRPTVHRRWDANTAILSGDAMLTMATETVCKCSATVLPEVIRLFNTTAMEVYQGQQMDMEFERRDDVTVNEYLEMIRLKTSVLLACACRMGAVLAGAPEDVATAMYEYGIALGMAFQLRDDWLDTFGDALEFGKEIGGDIINGKKTWLLITALEENGEELRDILREDLEDAERVRQVVKVFNTLNLSERCQALVEEYSRRATEILEGIPGMDREMRSFFTELAHKSACRTH